MSTKCCYRETCAEARAKGDLTCPLAADAHELAALRWWALTVAKNKAGINASFRDAKWRIWAERRPIADAHESNESLHAAIVALYDKVVGK